MVFNSHPNYEGKHAYLGASRYHWLNYDDEKFINSYLKNRASELGTRIHAFAAEAIRLGIKLPKTQKTLNMYVNDAIGYGLEPERVLFYSENCFGTADTIGFKHGLLRIHDLKTGETKASETQLEIYEALFCLEYCIEPTEIEAELRIYQNNDIRIHRPNPENILRIMDRMIYFDHKIEEMKRE